MHVKKCLITVLDRHLGIQQIAAPAIYRQQAREDGTIVSPMHQTTLLTPNVNYSGRTSPLTSKVAFYIFIQQI